MSCLYISYTRWFKYDRDCKRLVYTQIFRVIFEPPCNILPYIIYNYIILYYIILYYIILYYIILRRCIQKSQYNAHNTQVACSSRVFCWGVLRLCLVTECAKWRGWMWKRLIVARLYVCIMDSTTGAASGAEEMLPHVAVRSADRIVHLQLFVGTFNTCTAPTWMLEMTTRGLKLLPSDYSLHITI